MLGTHSRRSSFSRCRVEEMAQWIKPLMLNCEVGVWVPRTHVKPYAAVCNCNSSMLTGEMGDRDRNLPRGPGSASLVCSGESRRDRVSSKVEGEDGPQRVLQCSVLHQEPPTHTHTHTRMHMRAYTHSHTHGGTHKHALMHTCTDTHIFTQTHTLTHTSACIHAHNAHTHTYTCTHKCTHSCTFAQMHTLVQHTHAHTHTKNREASHVQPGLRT